jgi:hypothetical protein
MRTAQPNARDEALPRRPRLFACACAVAAILTPCLAAAYPIPSLVHWQRKISALSGGLQGPLHEADFFGFASARIDDIDGDGNGELAIGAPLDDDGGTDRGAVWILFLYPDGTVRDERKISDVAGGFTGVLDDNDHFGNSVTALGDLDGDGVGDIAVGAPNDDDHKSGVDPDDPSTVDDGAIWVLFLNANGAVKSHQKISMSQGGLPNPEPNTFHSETGYALAALRHPMTGNLISLAVGAAGDDDGGPFDRGAVWTFTLNTNGTVNTAAKISATYGGFTGELDPFDRFGAAVAWVGDADANGTPDLAVGAPTDDDGINDHGAIWILFRNADGSVKSHQKISATEGGYVVSPSFDALLGWSLASLGDNDGNGIDEILAGVPEADTTVLNGGALRILDLAPSGAVAAQQTIGDAASGFAQTLAEDDRFGSAVTRVGDIDGDGNVDLAGGASYDDGNGSDRGAIWILFLDASGAVDRYGKISDTKGRFFGLLDDGDRFGTSVTSLGDLDDDGVPDVAVGAPWDDDGGTDRGAVWVLFLNDDGTVKSHRKISDTKGFFAGTLRDGEWFGYSVAGLGDLDGDGVEDLAVGAVNDFDGGSGNRGAVWILFLRADGRVKSHQKISVTSGGFTGAVDQADDFGRSVVTLGDLDGDTIPDIAVGASRDDDGGTDRGAVWILFLSRDGTVHAYQKISDTEGSFSGILDDGDGFGWAVGALGDVDADDVEDLSVGAPYDDDGGIDRGAIWIVRLRANGRVKAQQKISATRGGFEGLLDDGDSFGLATAGLGDRADDGRIRVAAGAPHDDDYGYNRGACWLVALEPTGMVASYDKISAASGIGSPLRPWDYFGSSIAVLDDLDGNGFRDLAVGAIRDDDGGASPQADVGAIWILGLGEATTTTALVTTTSTMPGAMCGDANDDGLIAATDALIALNAAVGTTACESCVCDADASGAITAADALRLLRAAVGEPVPLACPPCGS